MLSWTGELFHVFAGSACVCAHQYAVSRCRLTVSPWTTFKQLRLTLKPSNQRGMNYQAFHPATCFLDKYDKVLLEINQLKRYMDKEVPVCHKRPVISIYWFQSWVIPFTSNWKSDDLFCQKRNMNCRLMAGFVLMLWVSSPPRFYSHPGQKTS